LVGLFTAGSFDEFPQELQISDFVDLHRAFLMVHQYLTNSSEMPALLPDVVRLRPVASARDAEFGCPAQR